MVLRRLASSLPVALAVSIGTVPAAASHHAEDLPVIHSVQVASDAWGAAVIRVADGERAGMELVHETVDREPTHAVHVRRVEDGFEYSGFGGGACLEPFDLHVGSEAVGVVIYEQSDWCSGVTNVVGALATLNEPGTYEVVVVGGSRGARSTVLNVRGTDPIVLVGFNWGDDVLRVRNEEFGGGLNARLSTWVADAQAVIGGAAPGTFDVSLYGWFADHSVAPAPSLSYSGPEGRSASSNAFVFDGQSPGTYTFHVDGKAGAGAVVCCGVYLLVADVTLPTAVTG